MNVFALHSPAANPWLRWTGSAIAIVAIHAGLIAAGIAFYRQQETPGVAMPAIMVDLAPASAAPETQPLDVAPGPEMQQAEAPSEPPPEPVAPPPPPQVEQPIPPTPVLPQPVVEAPPEQPVAPTPPPPEPPPEQAKPVPEPVKTEPVKPEPVKPEPVTPKPKPVHSEVKKKPSDATPAPRTTAAPRAERRDRAAAAAASGAAAAAALPSYRDRLAAHLQRYKEYPSEAKAAGKQGVAMLSFTVSRSGQVLASRLAGSSGVAALDAETLAMIRRAQPLPAFPPEMTQASLSFTVPVRFSIR